MNCLLTPRESARADTPPAASMAFSILSMTSLKHSFSLYVKRGLVGERLWPCDNKVMVEYDRDAVRRRLRQAMDDAGVSNTGLATFMGVSVQAVGDWLRTGKIASNRFPGICEKLGIRSDWLLWGEESSSVLQRDFGPHLEPGPEIMGAVIAPIVGTTQAGPDRAWLEEGYPAGFGDEYLNMPCKDPNAYALRVKGTSMYPRMEEGQILLVSPNTAPLPNDDVIVCLGSGEVMVKKLAYWRNGEIALKSVNDGDHPMVTVGECDVEFVHTVLSICRPGSVERRE